MTDEPRSPLRPSERPSLSAVQRFGPLALVLGALVAVIAILAATSPDPAPIAAGPAGGAVPVPAASAELPPGVESFARAEAQGRADDIDWGERCDTETGLLKIPQWPQPGCFQPFEGDNGGATDVGVTADEIKVVIYVPMEDDPLLKFIYSQIGSSDSPTDTYDTYAGFVEIFNTYYETYGRKVVVQRYDASGPVNDSNLAISDAEAIARDIQPFAVIGGPNLTNAFADTLAANEIMCIACTPSQPASWYAERSPYVWDVRQNADQAQQFIAEYLGKRLAGRPAKFAGDPQLRRRERVFGYIHVVSSDSSKELEAKLVDMLRDDHGVEFAAIQTYGLPTELAVSGRDIITKMKEAGVTTVLFSGDPLGPQTLTQVATEQDWFPEWVVGPSVLVDTAVFSRTYDQQQWAHAFGPSGLFARTKPGTAGADYVYRWFFGEQAPAASTAPLLAGPLQILFGALQGLGPNVTHEGIREVLFRSPTSPSTPISAQVSFGDRGVFPDTDYSALDDVTEIWWDPEAEGGTELGKEGRGMWRYVDGGKRYLPGEWPETEPKVFDPEGSVVVYDEPPPGVVLPDYEPIR